MKSSSSMSSLATSRSLIVRVQSREDVAWQRLVDLYGPLVFGWGSRAGLSSQDAADVMQEVFASVAKAIGRFDADADGRFRGWLWTIARNKIRDHYRRELPRENAKGGSVALRQMAELADHWDDEASEQTRHDVQALYQRAMQLIENDFQPQTWQAFWMSVVEEKSTEQIANELGLSANSVRQAKSRVLRRLREELGEDAS